MAMLGQCLALGETHPSFSIEHNPETIGRVSICILEVDIVFSVRFTDRGGPTKLGFMDA